jgi:hypothetical protein
MDASVRTWLHEWISDHFNSACRNSKSILEMHLLLFVASCLKGTLVPLAARGETLFPGL